MQWIWEEKFKVRISDIGFDGNIKVSSLFNYMQEVATNHANNIGIGKDDLMKNQTFWVLSRLKIDIINYPKFGEELKVVTWPKGTNKLFALRDFEIYGEDGTLVANATSAWLIVDLLSMKPQRPAVFADSVKKIAMDAIKEVPGKIKPQSDWERSHEKRVGYSDLDINHHVNNAKYVEWIFDCMDKDFFKTNRVKSLQVNFLSESKWEDSVELRRKKFDIEGSSKGMYVEGFNQGLDKGTFNAILEYRDLIAELEMDKVRNQNIINYATTYPLIRTMCHGESILMQGISDDPWIYFSSQSEKEFEKLMETCKGELYFAVIEEWMRPYVVKNKEIDWELPCMKLYFPESAELPEVEIAEDAVVRPLTKEDAAAIQDYSKYNDFTTTDYIEERIENGVGFGVLKEDVLVAWILTHDDGSIGFLNVLPEHRKSGYGQILTVKTIEKVRALNQVPMVCIESENVKSMNLAKKLGYVEDRMINWIKLQE